MHIYISGIGGSGMSALAHLCLDLGYKISGSDLSLSKNIDSLRNRGADIRVGQNLENINQIHELDPINWFIYTSALPADHVEINFAKEYDLKFGKRHELINYIIKKHDLKLIAVCGTHGKTTTAAMLAWTFLHLGIPTTYLIGTNVSFGNSGQFQQNSNYLIYEADEYDRNFLNFRPFASILTSIDYDHPDTYPTQNEYNQAFFEFLSKSETIYAYQNDLEQVGIYYYTDNNIKVISLTRELGLGTDNLEDLRKIAGLHNRQNAALVRSLVLNFATDSSLSYNKVSSILNYFPGTERRMEKLAENLYTDYAHHPVEIKSTIDLAREKMTLISENQHFDSNSEILNSNHLSFKNLKNLLDIVDKDSKLVIVYQPHQNSRQHEIWQEYKNAFFKSDKVYWLPTYLSRENKKLEILSPADLIKSLENYKDAEVADMNIELAEKIINHLKRRDIVVFMGAGTIDQWARTLVDKL